MENILIRPFADDIAESAHQLRMKNEFMKLGFSRAGFIAIVQEYKSKYLEYSTAKRLERWWDFRCRSLEINKDIEVILNKLKNE